MNFEQLRHEYMLSGLDEKDVNRDPFRQFDTWFKASIEAKLPLANAMSLATANRSGRVSSRAVLLKGVDARGFTFYTNFESRKAKDLDANPHAALLFCWDELERQVRIEGTIEKVSDSESDEYYHSRPIGARLGAWASPQSDVLADRKTLEEKLAAITKLHGDKPPRPPFWGGLRVVPDWFEFWQGRKDRLHDRISYRFDAGQWVIERLGP
ncbi:MAG: pyridoxamine 5'-phosphate oxidase [Burkholderiales bacterium]